MTAETELAEEMSENLQELSSDRLCWPCLQNPTLKSLPFMDPATLLIVELMSRVWPKLPYADITENGWKVASETICYDEILENEKWELTEMRGSAQGMSLAKTSESE